MKLRILRSILTRWSGDIDSKVECIDMILHNCEYVYDNTLNTELQRHFKTHYNFMQNNVNARTILNAYGIFKKSKYTVTRKDACNLMNEYFGEIVENDEIYLPSCDE